MTSHHLRLTIVAAAAAAVSALGPMAGARAAGGAAWDWSLPFDGDKAITDAMGEDLHVGVSAEAIDYLANGSSFTVRAPADGVVRDLPRRDSDYGQMLRIDHAGGATSFFAHLDRVLVSAGNFVKRGDAIAYSGSSGRNGSGNHLHFEARQSFGSSVDSGQALPTRAMRGNWFYTYYSPSPNFQRIAACPSGYARASDAAAAPSIVCNGRSYFSRHLAEYTSPPNQPYVHVTFDGTPSYTIHFGASPDTPGTSWDARFIYAPYNYQTGAMNYYATEMTSISVYVNPNDPATPQGTHTVWSDTARDPVSGSKWSLQRSTNVAPVIAEFDGGLSRWVMRPGIALIAEAKGQNVILEFGGGDGYSTYAVYKQVDGGSPSNIYYGNGTQIGDWLGWSTSDYFVYGWKPAWGQWVLSRRIHIP